MMALKLLFAALVYGMWVAHANGHEGIAALCAGFAGYAAGTHDAIERTDQ